jgi:zinc carboxypeptidase
MSGRQPSPMSRLTRRRFLQLSAAAAAASQLPLSRAEAGGGCHPILTTPDFRGLVPTPEDVLGFQVGREREVTTNECYAYLDALNAASDRVRVRTLAMSQDGRPIRYAVVGRPGNVGPAGLESVRQAHLRIRDPRTGWTEAADLARTTPAFLWVGANIHGNEESGTDASLRLLHGLADRRDCVVDGILDNAVVVVIPIQNPDGRERDIRRNSFGFDLNRDYFSRTQPETDAKVDLMRRYPPLMFTDHHEFGYYRSFFPPNDDPVYHEVTGEVLHFINDVYGPAIAAEFDRTGWDYFNRGQGYDFFSPIFTDTCTSFGFQGVGMTVEVYNDADLFKRYVRHLHVMWVSLATAASRKNRILRGWHDAFVDAVEEGRRGILQPNRVYEAQNDVREPVPDVRVRDYFILDVHPARRRETALLVRKLQRMDVNVYRLDESLHVPDFREHWEPPNSARVPAGTYWIPLAQPQKHWIQAAMNEDSYVPISNAYGLTGFSLALESAADVGWSGEPLHPVASLAPPVADPGAPSAPGATPSIAVFQTSGGVFSWESTGWLRHLLDNVWQQPYQRLRAADVRHDALDGTDVLIVPAGGINAALRNLGTIGQRALVEWVNAGGRYIGYRWGSAQLPGVLGLTDTTYGYAQTSIRDVLMRVRLDGTSPLADGLGPFIWLVHDGDMVQRRARSGAVAARFPTKGSGDFAVNGFPGGTHVLPGRGVIADELVGKGRVVTCSLDLNYRAETIGGQRLLWNAIFGSDPSSKRSPPAVFDAEAVARRAVRLPADSLPSAITVTVSNVDARPARDVLRAYGVRVRRIGAGAGEVTFALDNPNELTQEEHPFAGLIPSDLRGRGVDVRGFGMP